MNAPASEERLAAPLHRLALRVKTTVDPSRLGDASVALRAFIARPSAAGYLEAARMLRDAARRQQLNRLAGVAAPRLAVEHLATITAAAALPPELQALLSRLPPDVGTTRRFGVIGQMLTVHAMLAAHAETALQDLQDHLGQPTPRTPTAARAPTAARRRPRR